MKKKFFPLIIAAFMAITAAIIDVIPPPQPISGVMTMPTPVLTEIMTIVTSVPVVQPVAVVTINQPAVQGHTFAPAVMNSYQDCTQFGNWRAVALSSSEVENKLKAGRSLRITETDILVLASFVDKAYTDWEEGRPTLVYAPAPQNEQVVIEYPGFELKFARCNGQFYYLERFISHPDFRRVETSKLDKLLDVEFLLSNGDKFVLRDDLGVLEVFILGRFDAPLVIAELPASGLQRTVTYSFNGQTMTFIIARLDDGIPQFYFKEQN
ncbi:hypothetical protein A2Z33_05430 [Candidatus Gottesmanbacteria bacterium RBG_16_52_11]|uniref:Uncharacterized protein n=1 Tax=Candidatus Gottesmanbacteria bacterium RBG_16_52_11 TaxID=1798374 RepID=A0A1F5YWX6_9BACT|nr:MAG: hypothetical protein A2Z33_05430 [Candidatus Gottesmanbacteria bacterium RBG_16_52_11]